MHAKLSRTIASSPDRALVRAAIAALAAWAALGPLPARAAGCLVVGGADARVRTAEGERAPTFYAERCETLRLVRGEARVSWLDASGRPVFVALGPEGLPPPLARESAHEDAFDLRRVVAEYDTNRSARRAAYMRKGLRKDRDHALYVPPQGLPLTSKDDAAVEIRDADRGELLLTQDVDPTHPIQLARSQVTPGARLRIKVTVGDALAQDVFEVASAPVQAAVDAALAQVDAQALQAADRELWRALVLERFKVSDRVEF